MKDFAIIFDLDGTLLDTAPLIKASFNYTFNQLRPDLVISEAEHKSFLGPSLVSSFQRYFVGEEVNKAVEIYRAHNLKYMREYIQIFPTVLDTIKVLKQQGYPLAIVSTKYSDPVYLGLDLYNMRDYFDVIICGEHVSSHKPDPEGINNAKSKLGCQRGIYVGDNASDILAGKNANMITVGVSYSAQLEVLKKTNPDYIIDQLDELVKIVKEREEC